MKRKKISQWPQVFIIILNWNNWSDTLKCLNSLKKIDYPRCEIIVVDNGSKKKLKIKSNSFKQPIIQIFNRKNLGFAEGNNIGIRYALKSKADYVLLLNNDTLIEKNFLKELVLQAESDPKIGMIGPKIYFLDSLNKKKKKIWFAGGKLTRSLFNQIIMTGYGEFDYGQYNKIQKVDYITGCCLLVKKQVIERIGLLDKKYFLYYEDVDWSLRAQKAGFKCIYDPQAKIWHKGSATSREGSFDYIYYHIRNALLCRWKNGSLLDKMFVIGQSLWFLKKQFIKMIVLPKQSLWSKAIIKGILDFYQKKFGELNKL